MKQQLVCFKLAQYYTRTEIAQSCLSVLYELLGEIDDPAGFSFVEPAAGAGAFYDLLPAGRRLGIDICPAPSRDDILKQDFLKWQPPEVLHPSRTVAVGNPPFGHRGNLAICFFQRAALLADTIAFIVPVSFRKFFVHKQLPADLKWVQSLNLPIDDFELPNGSSYEVNAEFQIWSRLAGFETDYRQYQPPPVSHTDFALHQYNNTKKALSVFKQDFDFAVPCQGYQDYSRRETDGKKCEKHKQWMLFKANGMTTLEILQRMDFEELAFRSATKTPGFRKNDVITEYESYVANV